MGRLARGGHHLDAALTGVRRRMGGYVRARGEDKKGHRGGTLREVQVGKHDLLTLEVVDTEYGRPMGLVGNMEGMTAQGKAQAAVMALGVRRCGQLDG